MMHADALFIVKLQRLSLMLVAAVAVKKKKKEKKDYYLVCPALIPSNGFFYVCISVGLNRVSWIVACYTEG